MHRDHLLLYFLVLLLSFACSNPAQPQVEVSTVKPVQGKPDRRQLFQTLRNAGAITLVYSSEYKAPISKFRKMGETLAKRQRMPLQLNIKGDEELKTDALQEGVYFLIGTPKNNQLISQLSQKLPITISESGFTIDSTTYSDSSTVLRFFFYPNPENELAPIFLLTGNDEAAIYKLMEEKFGEDWSGAMRFNAGYEIYEEEELRSMGYFSEHDWKLDKNTRFTFGENSDKITESDHFKVKLHGGNLNEQEKLRIIYHAEATFGRIKKRLGIQENILPISYNIYPSIEQKGLMLNNTKPAHVEPDKRKVHVVVNDNFKGDQWQLENELLIRDLLGPPSFSALGKGLAIYFCTQWQFRGYDYWAQRLYNSENLPPLAEILDDNQFSKGSPMVLGASSASFVAFLIEHWGMANFKERFQQWSPSDKDIQKLEQQWSKWLEGNRNIVKEASNNKKELPYLTGFNFAHEGYRIYNGYGSKLAKKSLEKLHGLGTNAIAIVPYSYMRDPNKPSHIPLMHSAGSETDESVIFSHLEAKKMGMSTILKPQIWLGRSWPGEVFMNSEEDWQQFFDYYYRWIRHYTLLAEMYDMEVMCLGVEFAKATVAREDDWRQLFKKMNALYSGKLTYAANWGDEFEKVSFWDELDYIGIDCYYPLSKNDEVTKAELSAEFKKVLAKLEKVAKKYDKPLLFTEIGFRSVDGTWKDPHDDPLGRASNQEAQQLCYEVVFEGIEGKDWCKGILWWKWPCYTDYEARSRNLGFSPCTKLAEQTVEHWFKQLR